MLSIIADIAGILSFCMSIVLFVLKKEVMYAVIITVTSSYFFTETFIRVQQSNSGLKHEILKPQKFMPLLHRMIQKFLPS